MKKKKEKGGSRNSVLGRVRESVVKGYDFGKNGMLLQNAIRDILVQVYVARSLGDRLEVGDTCRFYDVSGSFVVGIFEGFRILEIEVVAVFVSM